jgi:predicted regulator of Ras-like GTPase activity (Roadblock/LC7/MglB family)
MIGTLDTTSDQRQQRLGFLLDGICGQVPGVRHAIAVSGDGMPLAASHVVDNEVRDQLAAAASGLMSLGAGMARLMDAGDPNHIAVNLDAGWVFVQRPSERLVLVVLAGLEADLGQVDHEVMRLGEAIGQVLEPAQRAAP